MLVVTVLKHSQFSQTATSNCFILDLLIYLQIRLCERKRVIKGYQDNSRTRSFGGTANKRRAQNINLDSCGTTVLGTRQRMWQV